VILGLLPRRLTNDGLWKGTALFSILMGALDLLVILSGEVGFALPPR